jgi:CheY-like chemotaxis protein
VQDLVAATASDRGLEVAWTAPGVPPLVLGDAPRVRQVLVNLVGNALKFTPRGGVMITAEAREHASGVSLRVSVADTGIGIPPERRSRLFTPFTQVDASHARRYGGTGLGLAISRRLCQLMGGDLWLGEQSQPGAVFHFSFEAAACEGAPAAHHLQPDQELAGRRVGVAGLGPFTRRMLEYGISTWGGSVSVLDQARGLDAELERLDVLVVGSGTATRAVLEARTRARSGETLPLVRVGGADGLDSGPPADPLRTPLPLPLSLRQLHRALLRVLGSPRAAALETDPPRAPRETALTAPLRILLAEDNAVNQKVALLMLEREGYRADVAFNGTEVLQSLRRQPYDVVLLDVQMPEMDGLEAARRIRAEWGPAPRLIALTANALASDREDCLAAGMDDFVAKPLTRPALRAALESASAQAAGPRPAASAPGSLPTR